jgi:hypothetical protein
MRDGEGAMEALNRSVGEGEERSIVEWRGERRRRRKRREEKGGGDCKEGKIRPVHVKNPI